MSFRLKPATMYENEKNICNPFFNLGQPEGQLILTIE